MKTKIATLLKKLSFELPEKEEVVKLGLLALLARESLFLLGPPGTAKSLTARRLKYAFAEAKSFEYLMGRFSTPEEIFGPFSIAGLRDKDVFERQTKGYLPDVEIAFLDEIWRASPPIQNALLTILNERVFRNGAHEVKVPLKGILGASNRLPESEESAEAFWDRFLIRLTVDNLESSENFAAMIQNTSDPYINPLLPSESLTPSETDSVEIFQKEVQIDPFTIRAIIQLREAIKKKGPENQDPGVLDWYVSDRRWKKIVKLLRVSAVLHNRKTTDIMDLFLAIPCLWNQKNQIADVENLVCQAVEEHGYLPSQPLEPIFEELEKMTVQWNQLTGISRLVEKRRPVLHGGEYYTLINPQEEQLLRIWGEDFDLLGRDEEHEIEVYSFNPQGEMESSKLMLARKGAQEAQILLGGQTLDLIHRLETIEERQAIQPNPEALQVWTAEVDKAMKRLKAAQKALEKEEVLKKAEAQSHLFVWEGYSDLPLTPLLRFQEQLNECKVRYEVLLAKAKELT